MDAGPEEAGKRVLMVELEPPSPVVLVATEWLDEELVEELAGDEVTDAGDDEKWLLAVTCCCCWQLLPVLRNPE